MAMELSRSTCFTTIQILPSDSAEEVALFTKNVRADYLGASAEATAAACGHQPSLMRLAIANLQTGKTTTDMLISAAEDAQCPDSGKLRVAGAIVSAVVSSLMPNERHAIYKLSMLPESFSASAAAMVLGLEENSHNFKDLMETLQQKGFMRSNMAFCSFGMLPAIRGAAMQQAYSVAPDVAGAATVAMMEYCLTLVRSAAAFNAANAQVVAMWSIDRERSMLDELVNLLHRPYSHSELATSPFADIVSKYMDLLAFRLSSRQQQELCVACAQGSRRQGDMLGEAACLQHLGLGADTRAADSAMGGALQAVEKALSPSHPVVADMLLSWARLQSHAGNYHQAEKLLRRSLQIQQRYDLGPKSMALVNTQTRLAGALIAQAAPDKALPVLQSALQATVKQLGPRHPDTALAQCRLASCLADLRQYESAHAIYLGALDGWRESLGHCHPQFAVLLGQLAFCSRCLGKAEEAEQYHRRSIQMWKEMIILDQPELQDDLRALVNLLHFHGRTTEAAEIREQLVRLVDAVRAAHSRATRKATVRRGLKHMLMAPLKACIPTKRPPATVALPSGIRDSDLEELRAEARKQAAKTGGAAAPQAVEVAAHAGVSNAAPDVEQAAVVGEAEKLHKVPSTAEAAPITQLPNTDEEGIAELPIKPLPGGLSDSATPKAAMNGKPLADAEPSGMRKSEKATPRAHEKGSNRLNAHLTQSLVPFGSKGRGPSAGAVDRVQGVDQKIAPTGEASVWAASLRNPAIPLSKPQKRTPLSGAMQSLSSRSDPSSTRMEARKRASKTAPSDAFQELSGSLSCDSPQATGDLIRALAVVDAPEETWPASDKRRSASSTSDCGSEETVADRGPAQLQLPGSGQLISQVAGGPVSPMGKSVMGFYNPMFAHYDSSQHVQVSFHTNEKAEI